MRQIAGAGVILAVAVAAMRLGGGPQTDQSASSGGIRAGQRQDQQKKTPAKPVAPYQGGCSAFLPDGSAASYPKDANRGAAKSVIDHFFEVQEAKAKASGSESSPLKAMGGVRYAIALAPDPRHTNLGLMFDREMVAIQQSAQDEGYSYNSSWLPWKTEASAYPIYADAERSDDETGQREACPGVLLFRKSVNDVKPNPDAAKAKENPYLAADPADPYARALVVLVVGEQPTGGLNEDQWANAIVWLNGNASPMESPAQPLVGRDGKRVPDPPRTLYLLGPTFSGSLVSLERELASPKLMPAPVSGKTAAFPSASTQVRILSGSISSCSSARWFQQRIADTRAANTLFGSFHENDELQIYRLLNYLDQQGTDPKDVAILSEDETAYAAAPGPQDPPVAKLDQKKREQAEQQNKQKGPPACEFPYSRAVSPVRFSYPRDISALRNAYEKESVFSSGTRSAHPILQENDSLVADPSNASDTIHSYGGAISPIAQEAVLYGLVSHLRSHHSQYLILRCTNPLDFLFLTRFFHRAYPEGRIVTVGADLLFRREIDTTEFRGVLALSNYPLLPRDQHWAALSTSDPKEPFPPHTHRIPDSHMEGIYLAGRYLFGDDAGWPSPPADLSKPLTLPFKAGLPDFADPFWMHRPDEPLKEIQAPTWLSVVGRDGYWPLAVLRDGSTTKRCLDERDDTGGKNAADCDDPNHSGPPPTLVRLSGTGQDGKPAHYDVDPKDRKRFYTTLLLKIHLAWEICVVCAVFVLLYQLFAVWRGREFTSIGIFALFRPVSAPSQAILLGLNCALASTLLFELLTIGVSLPSFKHVFGEGWHLAGWVFLRLAVVAGSYAVLLLVWPKKRWVAVLVLFAVLGLQVAYEPFRGFASSSGRTYTLGSLGDLFNDAPLLGFFGLVWLLLAFAIFTRVLYSRSVASGLSGASFVLFSVVMGSAIYWTLHARRSDASELPMFYRAGHLTSGVSPMVSVLFLLAGFYLWTWQALAGNTLLCSGRPLLPELDRSKDCEKERARRERWPYKFGLWYRWLLGQPEPETVPEGTVCIGEAYYRISHELGRRILKVASPLCVDPQITLVPIGLAIAAVVYLKLMGPPLLSLENKAYDWIVNLVLLFAFLLTIAEASRLYFTWQELRRLLTALGRLRLRRTFAKLRAIDSNSLWSVSGNVQRVQYHFFAQQLDAGQRLAELATGSTPGFAAAVALGRHFSSNSADKLNTGPLWEMPLIAKPHVPQPRVYIREVFNHVTAEVLNGLIAYWATETSSLSLENSSASKAEGETERNVFDMELSEDPIVRTAEEFVCFHYIAFIQNILARMRTMILSMVFLFVSVCFAISFYPFVPRTGISIWMMANLVFIAASVVYVYAGMERDATLSYITNTRPGSLGTEFYIKTATFLAGPVIGLLTTQFPAISETVLGWLQPGIDALK